MWESIRAAAKANRARPLPTGQGPSEVPLSRLQLGVWMAEQLHPGRGAFDSETRLRLRGPLHAQALEGAIEELGRRHRVLVSRLELLAGEPHLCVTGEKLRMTVGIPDVMEGHDLVGRTALTVHLSPIRSEEHLLVLRSNQLFVDAVSWGIICRELAVLYSALSCGLPIPLYPVPLDYFAFCQWYSEELQMTSSNEELEFWRVALRDVQPTEWPTLLSHRGEPTSRSRSLEMDSGDVIRRLAHELGTTPFAVVHSLVVALEHRYKQCNDVIIGLSVAGRNRRELRTSVGRFSNTVPVRTAIDGESSFADVVANVSADIQGALSHQDIPIASVVEALRPPRTRSGTPWFNTALAFSSQDDNEFDGWHGLNVERIARTERASIAARVDLDFRLRLYDKRLVSRITYDAAAIDDTTAQGLFRAFESLADNALRDPSIPVRRLSLGINNRLASAEDLSARIERKIGVLATIERRAAATPDACAVRSAAGELTYRDLMKRAAQWAHAIADSGVCAGDRVGVLMEPQLDLAPALLGIWAAGAAYVPLHPEFPDDRIRYVVDNAGAKLTVVSVEQLLRARALSLPLIAPADLPRATRELPRRSYDESAAAYIIYESGGLFEPTGVVARHHSVDNLVSGISSKLRITTQDVVFSMTTPALDAAIVELFVPLAQGATIYHAALGPAMDATLLASELTRGAPTVLQATPTHYTMLLDVGWRPPATIQLISMGEPLPEAKKKALLRATEVLWHAYGPTEATVHTTLDRCYRDTGITLGGCIPNTDCFILDANGERVPVGVVGELHIGGAGIHGGYWRRTDLTQQRFVELQSLAALGYTGRVYRTGDLCRYRGDGQIERMGRRDRQVTIRGYRVDLDEIEKIARAFDEAFDPIALPAPDGLGIWLFVRGAHDGTRAWELRKQLVAKLPRFAVPARIVQVMQFPRLKDGKLDALRLFALAENPADSSRAPQEELSRFEEQLARIWRAALGLTTIRRTDNFFDLGGHSLLALSVRREMRAEAGIQVTARSLLFDTLGQIAQASSRPADA